MKALPAYPSLYQINTRVWLTELSKSLGRQATLDDIPDAELDRLARMGFDWIWFLSVWQTGPAAQQVSRSNAGWRKEFQETLPDLREEDIAGSGFAITGYTVHEQSRRGCCSGPAARAAAKAWAAADARLCPEPHGPGSSVGRGAPGVFCPWQRADLARAPQNYCRMKTLARRLCCSRTDATRTSPAGRIPCSSTTAIRPRRKR